MKIAILSPWTISNEAVGGTERFVMDLAEILRKLGNKVDVYMLSGENYEKNGINYINLRISDDDEAMDEEKLKKLFGDFSKEESYIEIAKRLEKKIDIKQYDIIQLNSQIFLKAFKEKKRIFTIHTNPEEFIMSFGEKSFKTMIEIMKKEKVNIHYVTPSQYYASEYSKLSGNKINFIPHAIDMARLNKNINIDNIYNKYNIDKEYKNILLPSRLEPVQKQHMLFLKSFANVNENIRRNFQVICTGKDKQYEKYAQNIEKFCQSKKIKLEVTRFDYIYEAYSIADIVVLPSKSESFGYSALESLSLGIPTILNSIPTYLEITKGSKNSFIFNNTEQSLKQLLGQLLQTNLEKLEQTKLWNERYSIEEFGEKYIHLMKE